MSKLWDFITGRSKKTKAPVAERPFLHESVDLKKYPMVDFLSWHSEGRANDILDDVAEAYRNYLIREQNDATAVDIMLGPSSNGWILHCKDYDFTAVEYKHLLYLLQQRLTEYGYIVNMADIRSRERSTYIETIYRHYLKPSLRHMTTKGAQANQLYGNVTMELVSRDGNPYIVKLLANSYTDQNYQAAGDFSELMQILTTGHT